MELAVQTISRDAIVSISSDSVFLSEIFLQFCTIWLAIWMGIASYPGRVGHP